MEVVFEEQRVETGWEGTWKNELEWLYKDHVLDRGLGYMDEYIKT